MASKTSGSRKLKRKNLPKFEAVVYSKIPSDGLIVFSVHYLIEHKIEITLEDIVSLCFLLFPHKFGLKRYPRWPDSAPISRHWGDVRRKRYVTANDYLGYRLTSKGSRLVKWVAKVLGVKIPKPIAKVQPAQPRKAVVIPVEKTQAAVSAPVKKAKASTPKVPAEIQKKKTQPIQEEKATPPVPAKKVQPARAKKVPPTPTPVKQIQKREIKARPVQEEKATPPAPAKKVRPIRVKKATPVKQVQKPEIKTQPVREEKTTPPAPVKKIRSTHSKKVSPRPAEVKRAQKPEIKAHPVQEKKVTLLTKVKKIRSIRTKKVSPAPTPVKQVKAAFPVTKAKKAQPVQKAKATPSAPIKKVRPARAKKIVPVPVKQVQKPEVKAEPIRKAKATPPAPIKKIRPIRAKKTPSAPEKKAQAVKAPSKVKETKPAKLTISQPVIVEKVQAEPVSKEAKERAGKFTRMMERSDAYIHYKKNGNKSNISEFDFRSLLLCTMESSAETLARNVNLFKGYAGIHHRQDLIMFLVYCEEKFFHLLNQQNQHLRKTKK